MPTLALSFICRTCSAAIPIYKREADNPLLCASCGTTYFWDNGILLLGSAGSEKDYPGEGYALLAEVEPRHFWFNGRNRLILSTMREIIGPLEGRRVLDIGCGTGFVLAALERVGMITCGLDMHLAGLRYARKRTRGLLLCEMATRIPFSAQFDVVMLCDVIEHTSDDGAVLREASQALVHGGTVVITTPAGPRLWTSLDEASGHKRRYTRQTLTEAMTRAGLSVEVARYFNILLMPVQAIQRLLIKDHPVATSADRLQLFRRSFATPPEPLNTLFRLAMAADLPLSRLPAPFGASLIAIGRRE